jgi:hypothetical protein
MHIIMYVLAHIITLQKYAHHYMYVNKFMPLELYGSVVLLVM